MSHQNQTRRAGGAAGLGDDAFPGRNGTSELAPTPAVTQAKIDLLFDEIGLSISPMIATLEAALAMREAGNITGFVYGLRCAGAYWKNITANAKDLVALRQEGTAQ
jgi:hypothetical protein